MIHKEVNQCLSCELFYIISSHYYLNVRKINFACLFKIKVWWTEGQTTLCWPQELFRVGDYDSEVGELWDHEGDFANDESWENENGSQDSWETESETSMIGDITMLVSFVYFCLSLFTVQLKMSLKAR